MPTSITSSGITFDDATTLTTGVLPTANIANAAVTPAKLSQPYTLATQASASGTSVDFTGIPSWARRVTVTLDGVSTNGTTAVIVQLGSSSGVTTSGYTGGAALINGTNACQTGASSSGFGTVYNVASDVRYGTITCSKHSGNIWIASGVLAVGAGAPVYTAGSILLSGTLDRIRITTVNGADTFDAGTINISYEG